MNNQLWEIRSNGMNLHAMLPGWRPEYWQCCGNWTPDGKFFIFLSGPLSGKDWEIWALDERRGLLRKPSAEPAQLTTGPIRWNTPVPGKDGKSLFAVGFTPRGELSRLNTQTKQFQPFLDGISAQGLSFSGDGRFVAYVAYPEGTLWRANRDGGNPVQLTDPPIDAFLPRWSPDGTQIVFEDIGSPMDEIYTVTARGGSPKMLLPNFKEHCGDADWSPDGRRILIGCGMGGWDPKDNLRIVDLASRQVTIVPESEGKWSPRWSPDGRHIAATNFDMNTLMIFDVAEQRWSTLQEKFGLSFPAWSSDSQFLYFLHNTPGDDHGLYRIGIHGTAAEKVVDLSGFHISGWWSQWAGLDPTDAPLLLRDIGSNDIYALTLEEK